MLVCHTDKLECCQDTIEAVWNKIEIKDNGEASFTDVEFTRGDNGTVNLISIESNKISTFCCVVPNAIGVIQTVCVNSG